MASDIFTFEDHRIRTVALGGAAWFVAADACKALELAPYKGSYADHLAKLDADEITRVSDTGVKLPGTGMHSAKLISEPGLYKLIQASNKPAARRFDRWVRHDVLPAIRKDGGYVKGEEKGRTGDPHDCLRQPGR